MNKIKLLYDVVKTMKAKEQVNGVLTARIEKDQEEVFSLRNEFDKSAIGGAKTKVACELSMDGGKVKRESVTEFSTPGQCRLIGKLFRHHHRHHHGHNDCACGGIKGLLTRISFALGILGGLKAEEKENGAAVLSLNLSEVPEEMKEMLREKLKQRHDCHSHCGFLECESLEVLDGVLVMTVNDKREIERITVNLEGSMQNAESGLHSMTATAEVVFAW